MTHVRAMQALIDRLLMQEPLIAIKLLGDELADARWQELDAPQINAAVQLLLPYLSRLAGRLRTSLRQSGLPLSESGRAQLAGLLRLYRYAHQDQVEWATRSILDCYAAYVDVPQSLFVDLHQLVDLARASLYEQHPVGWQSIHQRYVAILTLAMVNPYGLTPDEMEDGFACLTQTGDAIDLVHGEPSPTSRFIDMTGKIMPHIALTPRAGLTAQGVFLDVGGLYDPEHQQHWSPDCRVTLSRLLQRLQFYFVNRTTRAPLNRATESARNGLITIGFLSVHHRLERLDRHDVKAEISIALAGLDWEGLEQPIRAGVQTMSDANAFKMDIDTGHRTTDMEWMDDPANGKTPNRSTATPNAPSSWDIVNFSATGFRFHWRLSGNSRAAVDDLLLVELSPAPTPADAPVAKARLAVGVVRWVRHMDAEHKTIDMGVQRMAGGLFASYARDFRTQGNRWRKNWPIIAQLDDSARLIRVIVPAELVAETQDILVIQDAHEVRLQLGVVCQTGQGFLIMEAQRVDA